MGEFGGAMTGRAVEEQLKASFRPLVHPAFGQLGLALSCTGFLLFQDLAERYSRDLEFLRKAYFAPARGENPFAEFLRQIEGWVRIGISNN